MFSQKNNLLSSSLLGYDSNTLPTDWEYDTNGLAVRPLSDWSESPIA